MLGSARLMQTRALVLTPLTKSRTLASPPINCCCRMLLLLQARPPAAHPGQVLLLLLRPAGRALLPPQETHLLHPPLQLPAARHCRPGLGACGLLLTRVQQIHHAVQARQLLCHQLQCSLLLQRRPQQPQRLQRAAAYPTLRNSSRSCSQTPCF